METVRKMSRRSFNPKKRNWAKCITALQVTKEALHCYIEDTFIQFEIELNKKCALQHTFQCFKGNSDMVKFDKRKWSLDDTRCPTCVLIFNEIMSKHHHNPTPQNKLPCNPALIGWSNCHNSGHLARTGKCLHHDDYQGIIRYSRCPCNPQSPLYWVIAKIFMKPGTKSDYAAKTDPAVLFKVMEHCKLFDVISVYERKNLTNVRNRLMHAPENQIDDDDMHDLFKKMVEFLENVASGLKCRPECIEAVKAIRRLENTNMVMSLQPEKLYEMMQKALQLKREALRHDIEVNMEKTKSDCGDEPDADMTALGELQMQLKMCEDDAVLTQSYEKYQLMQVKVVEKVKQIQEKHCHLKEDVKTYIRNVVEMVKETITNITDKSTDKLHRCEQCLEESRAGELASIQKLKESNEQIKQIEVEKIKLTQQVETLENEAVCLQSEIENLEVEKRKFTNKNIQLQEQIVQNKEEHDKKLRELDDSIEELTDKFHRCKQCLEESRASKRALKQKLKESNEHIKTIEEEKSKLIQQVQKLENEAACLQTEIENIEEEKRKLTDINNQLQEQIVQNKEESDIKFRELEKGIEDRSNKLRRCEQCLEESRAGELTLKQRVEKLQNKSARLQTEIENLEEDKRNMTNTNRQLQEQIVRNRNESDRKVRELNKCNEELQEKIVRIGEENNKRLRELEEVKGQAKQALRKQNEDWTINVFVIIVSLVQSIYNQHV